MTRWLIGLAALAALSGPAAAAEPSRPNILFLAVDDLNDWVGILGKRPDVKTPNIDRLAKQGVVFTRAYCAAPACNPSRAALMTGLRPSSTGVYHNDQPWRPVLKDAVTLQEYFMKNGYTAEGGGKIYHGRYNEPAAWNHWEQAGGSPVPAKTPVNGIPKTSHFDWGPVDAPDEEMADYHTASWACEVLKRKHDKPFFLAPGMIKPHLPFYAPKKYFDMYPLDKIEVPKTLSTDLEDIPPAGIKMARPDRDHANVLKNDQWKKAVQAYLACITFMDAQIGRVLDALDKSAYRDNTIVVFWSDHGWHLGEKEHWRKFALWEEATRVNLAIKVPGMTKPGGVCGRTVNLLDLYPTLVDLCGLPKKDGLEGNSLVPLLKDPNAKWDHPSITTHGRNNHALRTEKWRYIRYADGSEELYDHDADPLEWKNLATDPANAKLRAEFATQLPKTNVPDAPRQKGKENNKKKKKKKK